MYRHLLIQLAILFVVAPLCHSQTANPDIHSVSNTLWKLFPQESYLGFSGGLVYVCDRSLAACTPSDGSFYDDFLIFTLFYIPIREDNPGFIFGFIPARGNRGRVSVYNYSLRYTLRGTLLLVSNTWTP